MHQLNLPPFEHQLKKEDGKVLIFDVIRKKYIVLTPEEWVRQHFIHYLIHEMKYPKSLIRVEGGLSFNQLQKRSDIVVFNREGNPWMVIECKAPEQSINESTVRQASVYNATLKAEYLVVTNGMKHFIFKTEWEAATTTSLEAMPTYQ
jgi:hypothetical protein